MNAHPSIYSGPTANPFRDYENWDDQQEQRKRERDSEAKKLVEQEMRSAAFFEKALSCLADDWYSETVKTTAKGSLMSPDELLAEATWREIIHKVPRQALAKLLTSEAAAELRALVAPVLAKQFPEVGDLNG